MNILWWFMGRLVGAHRVNPEVLEAMVAGIDEEAARLGVHPCGDTDGMGSTTEGG